jgi:membrane protease YdiL (CAAX protease family)
LILRSAFAALCALFALATVPRALPAPRTPAPSGAPPWGWRELALVVASCYLVLLALGSWLGPDTPSLVRMLVMQLALGAGAGALLLSPRCRNGRARIALGIVRPPGPAWLLRALLAYALLVPALLSIGALWPDLLHELGWELAPYTLDREIVDLAGQRLVLGILLAAGTAPILEETIFRGLVQPYCAARLGRLRGLLATALLFTLLHPPAAWGAVAVLALFFGLLRERSRGLVLPITLHALHNGLQLAFALGTARA